MVENSNGNNDKPEAPGPPPPDETLESAPPRPPHKKRKKRGGKGRHKPKHKTQSPFAGLLKELQDAGQGGAAKDTGTVSDILALMLGSVPSFAAGETMLSASTYQSAMMANSVANQQRMNMVSMVATSACVEQLLELRPDRFWPDGDDDHGHDHEGG